MQWKVAYADFATAMMAFFMVLWLLSNAGNVSLEALADYFAEVDSAGDTLRPPLQRASPTDARVARPPAPDFLGIEVELAGLAREQIILDEVDEGLRIQLIDSSERPMFKPGSDLLEPHAVAMLNEVARRLLRSPHRIVIQGHATGQPADAIYGNWELSADRANAARRQLAAAGLTPDRFAEVTGRGAADPLYPDAPARPENRRITILLLREAAATPADFGRP